MEKSISNNQASLILILTTVALKLSVLPTIMTYYSKNNAYVTCFIALVFDFLFTLLIILLMRKLPNKTFFQLCKDYLSKPVAIIIQVGIFIYFFMKCLITILELHDYFIATLFEELNPIFSLLVIILFLLFMFNKSYRTIGRLLEICFWPLAVGLLFTLIYPTSDIALNNLLPIFQDGLYPIYRGLHHTSFAFGDYMILLMLLGHIDTNKQTTKTLLVYMSSILGFIFNFYVIFIGSFGDIAISQTLAISELPLHNPYPATVGRLEWLTIIIWTGLLLINAVIMGKCSCKAFDNIFECKSKKIAPIVTCSLLTIGLITSYLSLDKIISLLTSNIFAPIATGFQITLTLLLVLFAILYNRRNNNPSSEYTSRKKGRINKCSKC